MDPRPGETWREIGTDNHVTILNVEIRSKAKQSHRNYVAAEAAGSPTSGHKYVRYILLDQFPRQFERVKGVSK